MSFLELIGIITVIFGTVKAIVEFVKKKKDLI